MTAPSKTEDPRCPSCKSYDVTPSPTGAMLHCGTCGKEWPRWKVGERDARTVEGE